MLKETGFSPLLLELEVTEDILLEDDEMALETFRRVQALGVHIAFDDFGTGYASLTYLKKFPLDRLKIDQSFVRELRADSDDAAIVGCTINLGKLLGLSVIAEGIEDAATAELLKGMGCEEGQGYYFGPPMPAAEFERKFLLKDGLDATAMECRHRRLNTIRRHSQRFNEPRDSLAPRFFRNVVTPAFQRKAALFVVRDLENFLQRNAGRWRRPLAAGVMAGIHGRPRGSAEGRHAGHERQEQQGIFAGHDGISLRGDCRSEPCLIGANAG